MDTASYWAMGGYAAYIWPSYLLTALVMGALALWSWRSLKSNERELELLQAQRGPRRRRTVAAASAAGGQAPAMTPDAASASLDSDLHS